MQLRVFGLGLFQDGVLGKGIFLREGVRCLPLAAIGVLNIIETMHHDFIRKEQIGVRSDTMGKPSAWCFVIALFVSIVVVLGYAQAQTTTSGVSKIQGSGKVTVCNKDSECPSGQRCGFSGSKSKGKCVVPSHDAHSIDPGGRCGCDGRPVDIFCAVGSPTEYTSAPTNAIGPCPKP